MMPFQATHEITDGVNSYDVMEHNKGLYTRAEWDACEAPDWSYDAEGRCTFQGDAAHPACSTATIRRL